MNRKKRALLHSRTLVRDPETGEVIQPSRISSYLRQARTPFLREFWSEKFASTDNETLVDSKLLSYAYLEAGIIETLGA